MEAIYHGRLAHVTGDTGEGVILDGEVFVSFDEPSLVLDPTDAQVRAVEDGTEIPMDPDEMPEIEALMREMEVPEHVIRGAMEIHAEQRPREINR